MLFVLGHHHGFALGAHHDFVFGQLKLSHAHRAHAHTCCKQSGLIDQVGEIRTGEPGRSAGDLGCFNILRQRHLAHMHLEDLFPTANVRKSHHNLPVEAPRTQ